jgi:hypothetical protein
MTVVRHTPPAAAPTGSLYTVTVNGQAARVYATDLGHFINFSTDEDVTIAVTFNATVTTALLSPRRKNIPVEKSGSTVTFTLSGDNKNGNYVLRLNDPGYTDDAQTMTWHPLFIFANPLEVNAPTGDSANIKYIGPGDWYVANATTISPYTGSETVSDNYYDIANGKTLYIHGDAVLRGKIKFGSDSNAGTGVASGTLRGRGIVNATYTPSKGRTLRVNHSSNVTVEGLVFVGGQHWNVAARKSNNCTFNWVKSIAHRVWSGSAMTGTPDGFDMVASSNMTVSNFFSRSYDDGATIKSDQAGGGWANAVDNVTYENGMVYQAWGGNGIEVGYETPQPITNVTFRGIDIIKTSRSTGPTTRDAISVFIEQGADVTNVTFEDITVEETHPNLIGIVSNADGTTVSNVTLKNITSYQAASAKPIEIKGFNANSKVSGVTFENLRFEGPNGFAARGFTEGLSLIPAGTDAENYRENIVFKDTTPRTPVKGWQGTTMYQVVKGEPATLTFEYEGPTTGTARFAVTNRAAGFDWTKLGTATFGDGVIVVELSDTDTEHAKIPGFYKLDVETAGELETVEMGRLIRHDPELLDARAKWTQLGQALDQLGL